MIISKSIPAKCILHMRAITMLEEGAEPCWRELK